MTRSRTTFVLATVVALAACGGDDAESAATGRPAGELLGPANPGSPNTPAAGCLEGFDACGDVCARLDDDARHCGACGNACPTTCAAGACVEGGTGCLVPCGGNGTDCASNDDADDCGACDNRCSDTELCWDGACRDGGGEGTSCASPLVWDVDVEEHAGFRMSGPVASHVFSCGPAEAIPTRFFRFDAPKANGEIEIDAPEGDDYVLELYTDAACAGAARLACNDGPPGKDPELDDLTLLEGATYFLAVGLKGSWSGNPAGIRVDH